MELMTNNNVVIADIEITRDLEGRYNLNALHRASGNDKKDGPSYWLSLKTTQDLIDELEKETTVISVVSVEGRNGGTFAHELLAISYAGWVSASFQLKVNQVFLDSKKPKQAIDLGNPNQLRALLLDNVEKVIALEHQVKEQSAKIESLENLFTDGMSVVSFCKQLNGVNTQKINSFLFSKKWLCNEGNWRVASYARDKYLTESVAHEYTDSKGVKQIKYKQELLRKGAQRLHQMYTANELPMKKGWNGIYTHDKYAEVA